MATVTFTFPHNVVVSELDGPNIVFMPAKGDSGTDGYTPVKGVDYWTSSDIAEFDARTVEVAQATAVQYVQVDTIGPGDTVHADYGLKGAPMKSVLIDIVPIQSGSGDPSPSNVRTISSSGRTSVSVMLGKSQTNVTSSPTTYTIDTSSYPIKQGQLDAISGEHVVSSDTGTIEILSFDGSSSSGWSALSTSGGLSSFKYSSGNVYKGVVQCNYLIPNGESTQERVSGGNSQSYFNIYINTSRLSTNNVSGLMAYFQEHPLQVTMRKEYYSTKSTHSFAPVVILTLSGANYLRSDSGQVTAEVPINIKQYVDDRLS